eukprot:CAMPEP_0184355498 /NCGR_PEP_ID=MMETSP1089-20130417/96523_1 /TAXON_ID=38269 ORGANISM="Gloeochaete wittrockiana, Strain SAG46.84" /NCGR_SAMPLE_ID=MMETSP1089 /ASSEMBLY_ACC=CAM_ASM_000445 /LENGTH=559 /DNA_ID=CAMNT_0026692203 /DNA_START=36 /DNA_END=1716 /DNA_ORIENTATION=+
MNVVKELQRINAREARLGVSESASWHAKYKDSAYVFVGGLEYGLTEGDVITIMSQFGEIVDCNLVRDKTTGKSKGFAFIAYEDQRSTVLAVDNLNGAKVLGRTLRVDHCAKYRGPKEDEKEDEEEGKPDASPSKGVDADKWSHDKYEGADPSKQGKRPRDDTEEQDPAVLQHKAEKRAFLERRKALKKRRKELRKKVKEGDISIEEDLREVEEQMAMDKIQYKKNKFKLLVGSALESLGSDSSADDQEVDHRQDDSHSMRSEQHGGMRGKVERPNHDQNGERNEEVRQNGKSLPDPFGDEREGREREGRGSQRDGGRNRDELQREYNRDRQGSSRERADRRQRMEERTDGHHEGRDRVGRGEERNSEHRSGAERGERSGTERRETSDQERRERSGPGRREASDVRRQERSVAERGERSSRERRERSGLERGERSSPERRDQVQIKREDMDMDEDERAEDRPVQESLSRDDRGSERSRRDKQQNSARDGSAESGGESNPEATAGKATRGLNVVRKAGQETEMVEKERKGDVKETRAVDEDMNPMKTETGSGDVNNESVML